MAKDWLSARYKDPDHGMIFNLDNGQGSRGGQQFVLDDDLLDKLRAEHGWTLTKSRNRRADGAKGKLGTVPSAFATDEAYEHYLAGSRENAKEHASEEHTIHEGDNPTV